MRGRDFLVPLFWLSSSLKFLLSLSFSFFLSFFSLYFLRGRGRYFFLSPQLAVFVLSYASIFISRWNVTLLNVCERKYVTQNILDWISRFNWSVKYVHMTDAAISLTFYIIQATVLSHTHFLLPQWTLVEVDCVLFFIYGTAIEWH